MDPEKHILTQGEREESTKESEKKQRVRQEPECRGWKVNGRKPVWITFRKPGW